ncbi:O-antigen ligase family protein, partial [bacterium]|nr:O-antigen ligase family protein [bacterium]
WQTWLLKFIFAPFFIGSLAPVVVGLMQSADQNAIKKVMVYFIVILLFLTICQAVWLKIKNREVSWRTCLLKYFLTPFLIGSIVPAAFCLTQSAAVFQKKDIWFGAHKFYIWPWMNRINATFFDPNALGSYLIIAVPIALAGFILLISIYRWLIAPALVLAGGFILCCVFFMASSGSRISFVGLVLFIFFVLTFFLIIKIEKLKTKVSSKIFKGIAAFSIILYLSMICFVVYSTPSIIQMVKSNPKLSKTTIAKRLDKMDVRSVGDIYKNIKKDRGVYARIAMKMIKEVPLTGVGLGSFITELPNYRKLTNELVYVPDTACNYYLQIGSEQGLITLAIIFLIFVVWFRKWLHVMHNAGVLMYWIVVGSGIASMLVVFLFGMHTLAHEIQCLFWICLAQPFIAQPEGWKEQSGSKYLKLLIFLICVVYFCTSMSKLSLEKQKKKFGWKDKSQFYQWENWPDPKVPLVRYSKKESSEEIKCAGIIMEQKWCALYPDIEENPVIVSFQLGNQVTNLTVENNDWHTMKIRVSPENNNKKFLYSVNVSRTWKASAFGMSNDKRRLGLLLNKISWKNSKGMYKKEKWADDGSIMAGKEYRWTEKNGEMAISLIGKYIKIPLLIGQPDVVTVLLGVNKTNLTELIIANNAWQEVTLFCGEFFKPDEKKKNVILDFSANKTMTPENYGISDGRTLGVAVGNPVSIKDFGFYDKQKWENDFDYRWAGKEARWAAKSNSNGVIKITYLVNHPDIIENPIKISFDVNGERKITENVYYPNWKIIEMHAKTNSWNDIIVKVDRTWQPKEIGIDDHRELGFAIKCE